MVSNNHEMILNEDRDEIPMDLPEVSNNHEMILNCLIFTIAVLLSRQQQS